MLPIVGDHLVGGDLVVAFELHVNRLAGKLPLAKRSPFAFQRRAHLLQLVFAARREVTPARFIILSISSSSNNFSNCFSTCDQPSAGIFLSRRDRSACSGSDSSSSSRSGPLHHLDLVGRNAILVGFKEIVDGSSTRPPPRSLLSRREQGCECLRTYSVQLAGGRSPLSGCDGAVGGAAGRARSLARGLAAGCSGGPLTRLAVDVAEVLPEAWGNSQTRFHCPRETAPAHHVDGKQRGRENAD